MHEKDLLQALRSLRAIEPRPDFSQQSRLLVLSEPNNSAAARPQGIFATFTSALSLRAPFHLVSFAAVAAVVVLGIYYTTNQLSPLLLPGLNQNKIVAEAEMVSQSISVELNQMNHFSDVATQSNAVLDAVAVTELNHLNTSTLRKETTIVEDTQTTPFDIDRELNALLNTIAE